ncbi:Glyco_tranf_GTA_type domain containing protein [uncultured Caudovirales phage]|uniref:Glyco_tranf_GTA_type domain containing protein n=1 Tax=uncultured Caudovirales phage TaxID=2100421 RepID=A0A6J7WPK1_9CAUD|nr:Glyco_tranf_GTA_type domain containing protein [uncultured Caudovirales phage]CAB4124030.1 Glyco_tranf_GTA_type domain containing protein [uncultured Caudovirales phage]CAB5219697.1 Glyco_tranf_GTA_type domain containing protein [uncultured Caudovirales phage]
MRVNAIINCGNDVDIIEQSVRHNMKHFVKIMVMDNESKDGTLDVLDKLQDEFQQRLIIKKQAYKNVEEYVEQTNLMALFMKKTCEYLFLLDADEFLFTDEKGMEELNLIPPGDVGIVKWRCYLPNRLEHKNYIEEMTYRRDREPDGCHKVVLPYKTYGELVLGNHYLHQERGTRSGSVELQSMFLAHFPVRSLAQFNKKVDFITAFLENGDESQSFHLRKIKKLTTLEEMIDKALNYADNGNSQYIPMYEPLENT